MPAKKAKKPARSVRYLLSGDRRLQKLSLRKMSQQAARPKARPRPPGRRAAAPSRSSRSQPWTISPRTIAVGAICVLAAAALIRAGQPGSPTDLERLDVALSGEAASPAVFETRLLPERPVEPRTPAAPKAPPADVPVRQAAVIEREATPALVATARVVAPEPVVKASAGEFAAREVEASAKAPAESTPAAAAVPDVSPVTITGCVAFDDQAFWLKDTSGADAPKSRNWRSGFLRKRPASIELEAPGRLGLSGYVGQRVAATGVVTNREMRVQAVRRVAGSCG